MVWAMFRFADSAGRSRVGAVTRSSTAANGPRRPGGPCAASAGGSPGQGEPWLERRRNAQPVYLAP